MNVFTTNFKYRRELKIFLAFLGLCVAVTLLVFTHKSRKVSNDMLQHDVSTGDTIVVTNEAGCTARAKVIASHQQQIKLRLVEGMQCKN